MIRPNHLFRMGAAFCFRIITNGGRVLNVTALRLNYKGAIENCYNAVRTIGFDRMHYRTDIAYRATR